MTIQRDRAASPLKRLDRKSDGLAAGAIPCVSCVRNEALRLPYFIDYHRRLGIDRFFFIDNGSTDGTVELLLAQPDVHVYSSESSYAGSNCGVDWINEVLSRHARGTWALTLDADELLVYPQCEHMTLPWFIELLDRSGAQAFRTFMLDMYSDRPIRDTIYEAGRPFAEVCRFFDPDGYIEQGPGGLPHRGGPRHRLFWEGKQTFGPAPVLEKFPLLKCVAGVNYLKSTHVINDREVAPFTGVLLHFKLFSDFYRAAEAEAARAEHWNNAAQYRTYWKVLAAAPALSAYHPGSLSYSGSEQLIALGLMKTAGLHSLVGGSNAN